MRVLVVEDQKDIRESLIDILMSEGYSVDSCEDGEEALDFFDVVDYDVVLLDIMLPKMNGYEVVQHMRVNQNDTPVLFLSAKGEVEDRIKGLDLGGDDYLVKPFYKEELLARLRVVIRRKVGKSSSDFNIDTLQVDTRTKEVRRNGKLLDLSMKEFSILEYLIQNQGVVLSRDQILEHVWNYDYMGASNIVDVYINYLRKKVDIKNQKKLIHTVRGAGYVLKVE